MPRPNTPDTPDAAFARLAELLEQLPAIQEADARLTRAHNARKLREAHERATTLEAEIVGYETMRDQALMDAKAAADIDDSTTEAHKLVAVRAYDELRYTRLATMQRSQNELRQLLKAGPLALEDPLDEYALVDAEYRALETRVNNFQEEYQRLFEYCRRLEGLVEDEIPE
jgi:rhamnose utilization protein RhaD (predicted bifunctional aldolase and dehydrogenase)